MSQAVSVPLADWLVVATADNPPIGVLYDQFCRELRNRGLPVWRSTLIVQMFNPRLGGSSFTWLDGELQREDVEGVGNAVPLAERLAEYAVSPLAIIEQTGSTFRRRLDAPLPQLPLLEGLRRQGATDYVAFRLPFLNRARLAAISYATQADGGFGDDTLAALKFSARLFSPYVERYALQRTAIDLLDTYIGHSAGERVFAGRIRRGDVETIEAAIWLCDLRDFTRYSNTAPPGAVIEMLNIWYDCLGEAIDDHGGEILKFMGDGLLAIFLAESDAFHACAKALAAMRSGAQRITALNAQREADGEFRLSLALALHYGPISYGNIGSRRRLDFTAIGPAVNLTSRLLEFAKSSDHSIVTTRDFAAAAGEELRRVGRVSLRGFDRPVEVCVPNDR